MSLWSQGSFLAYGMAFFTKSGYEGAANSRKWQEINSLDLSGRSFMVTGANSGLGFSASMYFASRGGTVHLICRSKEKGEAAVEEIKQKTGNEKVILHLCDVSRRDEIKRCIKDFESAGYSLDVLVNNVGVMLDKREETPDGIDETLATNTISTFLFTVLLIPTLARGNNPRVITVSSGGMLTEKLLVQEKYEKYKGEWVGRTAYARTKRHQLALTEKFAEKFKDTGILFVSMHPGWADTPQVHVAMKGFYEALQNKFRTPEQGADTICWLAVTDRLAKEDNGQFFRDRTHEIKHFCISDTRYKAGAVDTLWNWCCELSNWSENELEEKLHL